LTLPLTESGSLIGPGSDPPPIAADGKEGACAFFEVNESKSSESLFAFNARASGFLSRGEVLISRFSLFLPRQLCVPGDK
jgi:hypothetical protein